MSFKFAKPLLIKLTTAVIFISVIIMASHQRIENEKRVIELQRINDSKPSFNMFVFDYVRTPNTLDDVDIHLSRNGHVLLRQGSIVSLNGIAAITISGGGYLGSTNTHSFSDVPVASEYVFEVTLSDGSVAHMVTIDNSHKSINVEADIAINLDNRKARLDRDLILKWKNIDDSYLIELTANYTNKNDHPKTTTVPLLDIKKNEGQYIFPQDQFFNEHRHISILQFSFYRSRRLHKIGDFFNQDSDVRYVSNYSKSINFR